MSRYSLHRRGVELHLDLHVLRDGHERGGRFLEQHLARLRQRIDVGGVAVAMLREALHQRVVVVAHPETEHRERDPALALARDVVLERVGVGEADVEVPVGGEDDAVHPAGDEVLRRPGGRLRESPPRRPSSRPRQRRSRLATIAPPLRDRASAPAPRRQRPRTPRWPPGPPAPAHRQQELQRPHQQRELVRRRPSSPRCRRGTRGSPAVWRLGPARSP